MTDTTSKSGGQAGMVKGGNWGSQDGKASLGKGPNKPATPDSGIHVKNPHIGGGKGERMKGGPFAGV